MNADTLPFSRILTFDSVLAAGQVRGTKAMRQELADCIDLAMAGGVANDDGSIGRDELE